MKRFVAIPWSHEIRDWPPNRWYVVGNLRRIAHENEVLSRPIIISKRELNRMAGPGVGRAILAQWIDEALIEMRPCGNKGFIPREIKTPN